MSTPKQLSLTKDEIEEELVNNDLLNSGGVENETVLNVMNLKEKQQLLRKVSQSKEEFHNESCSSPQSTSLFDASPSNFPSLPIAGKNNSEKKLKLPRKQPPILKKGESPAVDNAEKSFSVHNVSDKKFNLPFCMDDGALPLTLPERPKRFTGSTYCVMKGEDPTAALIRMLAEHDKWKAAYTAEISRIKPNAIGKEIEESDNEEQQHSPKLDKEEDEENDPYLFVSNSPNNITKFNSGSRKRETNTSSTETVNTRQVRTLQRKASRDSDCEEVENILKPAEVKIGEWIQVPHQKSKRNKKQLGKQEKGRPKSVEDNVDLQFDDDFNKKWDAQSQWRGSQSPSLGSLNNQLQPRRSLSRAPEVEEETIECPICQKRFPQSKVENHAANCEGYSDSPMDIEEN